MDATPRPLILTLFSIYFACAGFATLVAGAAAWHFAGGIPWLEFIYAGMNGLFSYAFYTREEWLLPTLTLNFIGYTCLYLAAWWAYSDVGLPSFVVSTLLAGGALAAVYAYRHTLRAAHRMYVGYAFLTLWILAFTYTASLVL